MSKIQNELLTNVNPIIVDYSLSEEDIGSQMRRVIETTSPNVFILLSKGNSIILVQSSGWFQFDEYYAIGDGAPYALGSLFTTSKFQVPATDRVKMALEAAMEHCPSVREPFIYAQIP